MFSLEQNEIHLRDYFYVLRKRRKAIAIFFLSVLLIAVALTLIEMVLYKATATILIERENPNVVDFKEVMALDASSTDYYQTQYKILESRSLISALIEKEKLKDDSFMQKLMAGRLSFLVRNYMQLPAHLGRFFEKRPLEDLFISYVLKVEPVRNSRLVKVNIFHPDPQRAAQIANGLIDLYIQRNLEDRFMIANRATELIADQLSDLKERVANAERKVQKYKEDNALVNIPSIREKDEFIKEAKLELVKIQSEEAKLAQRYLPKHPKRIHIHSQIETLQKQIEDEEKRMLELSGVAIDYAELEREAESAKQIYKSLLSRLEETTSEAETQASNILIVDRAVAPTRPAKPRPLLNLLIAFILGSMGGVAVAFFLEYFDSTIKIPEDIEKALGLELFGVIAQGEKGSGGGSVGEIFLNTEQPTATGESFRALRTVLLFKLRHIPGSRVLLITSPNPEEGKSTVSINLAAALQQNHLKVLLIDGDLRRPRLHRIFNVDREKGLKEILEGELDLNHGIRPNVAGLGFDFMPCGASSHHPTEILGSSKMSQTIEALKKRYDFILIDSPPYLAVADVPVISEFVHGIIVVTKYQKTDRRHLHGLKKRFSQASADILGVVINQVSMREKDYYYHQYYYYGYGEASKPK